MLTFYRVTITNTGLTTGDSVGFIDDLHPKSYDPRPTTDVGAYGKLLANIRWKSIINRIAADLTAVDEIQAIDKPGADGDTPATSMSFTLIFSRNDWLVSRRTMETNELALKEVIAAALMGSISGKYVVYRPENIHGAEEITQYITAGPLASSLAMANAMITVTPFIPE